MTFDLPEKDVLNAISTPQEELPCHIILKSMHKMYKLWPRHGQFMNSLSFGLQV